MTNLFIGRTRGHIYCEAWFVDFDVSLVELRKAKIHDRKFTIKKQVAFHVRKQHPFFDVLDAKLLLSFFKAIGPSCKRGPRIRIARSNTVSYRKESRQARR